MSAQLNHEGREILNCIMQTISGAFRADPDATPTDVITILLRECITSNDPAFKGMAYIIIRACVESSLDGMSRAVFIDRMNIAVGNVVQRQQQNPIFQLLSTIEKIIKQKSGDEEKAPAGATLN